MFFNHSINNFAELTYIRVFFGSPLSVLGNHLTKRTSEQVAFSFTFLNGSLRNLATGVATNRFHNFNIKET